MVVLSKFLLIKGREGIETDKTVPSQVELKECTRDNRLNSQSVVNNLALVVMNTYNLSFTRSVPSASPFN